MSILRIRNAQTGKWEPIDALVGEEGPAGPPITLSIGTVEKGENASATITGESPNQELNLVLPRGDPGQQGEPGIPGTPGPGLSRGGKKGQIPAKRSNTDYDIEWIDAPKMMDYDSAPVGAMFDYPSLTPPTGYKICDGSELSRAEYSELFTVIGTTYGSGNGSTTFNLPNKLGRLSIGYNSEDADFNTLGKTGGSKTHTQTIDELAEHGHGWVYTISAQSGSGAWISSGAGEEATDVITKTGKSKAMDIMNPYIVSCPIIKVSGTAVLNGNVIDSLEDNSTTNAPSQRAVREALNDKAYIKLFLANRQSIQNGDNSVLFDKDITFGKYFKREGSTIKVLKDCLALLSANVFVDGSENDGYVWANIKVNDHYVSGHLERIINRDYTQSSIPSIPQELKVGDIISINVNYSSTVGNPSVRNDDANTFLSVVKI